MAESLLQGTYKCRLVGSGCGPRCRHTCGLPDGGGVGGQLLWVDEDHQLVEDAVEIKGKDNGGHEPKDLWKWEG